MHRSRSLVTALALMVSAAGFSCSEDTTDGNTGGKGGSTSGTGGARSGGGSGSTGGSTGTGGSVSTGGSTGAGGSSTGGSGAGGSGAGGATGGAGGKAGSGGAGGKAGSGGGSGDAGTTDSGGASAFSITIDHIPHPTKMGRLCFKPEASNSGGNKSPKMDWTTPPTGTKSLVLITFDQSNNTPHQVVCNIPPDVMGRPADTKTMIPMGAQSSTGHSKPGNMWYGPGAGGAAHAYEIRVWALSTPMLEGGCGTSGAAATRAIYTKLKMPGNPIVLATDGKVLHGNVNGSCD